MRVWYSVRLSTSWCDRRVSWACLLSTFSSSASAGLAFNIDSKQQRMAQIQLFCLGLDVRSVLPMSGPMALHCSSSLGSSGGSASPVVGSASWSRPSSSQILASSIVCWAGKVTCSSAQNCVVHTS